MKYNVFKGNVIRLGRECVASNIVIINSRLDLIKEYFDMVTRFEKIW